MVYYENRKKHLFFTKYEGRMDIKPKLAKVKRSTVLPLMLVNLVFAAFCLLFCHAHFENNDDFVMMGVVSGLFGSPDPHMVFINIFAGKFLAFLYSINRSIPWYVIGQIMTIFLSCFLISYVILDNRPSDKKRYICLGLFYVFFAYECYVNIQFTKTGGIAAIAGLALIVRNVTKEKISYPQIVFGFVLSVIGSMIRFNSFMIALSATGAFFLVYLYFRRPKLKRIVIISVLLAGAGAVSLGLRLYDTYVYEHTDGWDSFRAYNLERAKFTDRPMPSFAENRELYDSLGISANDIFLFSHWTFDDPDFCTIELMEKVDDEKTSPSISSYPGTLVKKILPGNLKYTFTIGLILISLLVFYQDRKNLLLLIPASFALLFYNTVFITIERYLVRRVDLVIAVSMFVMFSLFLEDRKEETKIKPSFFVILVAAALALNIGTITTDVTNKDREMTEEKQEYRDLYDRMYADKDHIYLTQTLSDKSFPIYRISDSYPEGYYGNTYWLGEWLTKSPINNGILANYGLSNPFRDAVDNEAVYMVSNEFYMPRLLRYVKEHYCPTVEAEVLETTGELIVFRLVSQSKGA